MIRCDSGYRRSARGRPVALKVVRPELGEDPEFRHRFTQEVASARRIHGLSTAQVVDAYYRRSA
ncbi:hypothetical protein ACIF6L_29910 [Kitasatospora sp. NPDC086009]|uniref:hypothetical protein n=1 Tax=unclassified Kitasatospora TaxID=2633591 RepID=UPI0037C89AE3